MRLTCESEERLSALEERLARLDGKSATDLSPDEYSELRHLAQRYLELRRNLIPLAMGGAQLTLEAVEQLIGVELDATS